MITIFMARVVALLHLTFSLGKRAIYVLTLGYTLPHNSSISHLGPSESLARFLRLLALLPASFPQMHRFFTSTNFAGKEIAQAHK